MPNTEDYSCTVISNCTSITLSFDIFSDKFVNGSKSRSISHVNKKSGRIRSFLFCIAKLFVYFQSHFFWFHDILPQLKMDEEERKICWLWFSNLMTVMPAWKKYWFTYRSSKVRLCCIFMKQLIKKLSQCKLCSQNCMRLKMKNVILLPIFLPYESDFKCYNTLCSMHKQVKLSIFKLAVSFIPKQTLLNYPWSVKRKAARFWLKLKSENTY